MSAPSDLNPPDSLSVNGREPQPEPVPAAVSEPIAHTMPAEYPVEYPAEYPAEYRSESAPAATISSGGTAPYVPAEPISSLPVRPRSRGQEAYTPPTSAAPTGTAALLVPRGAVELLPNESVVFQLGALYLTNKRVILLAPSVLRTAFLRDVDAIGTMSERASGWSFFFGLVMLGLAGSAVYFSIAQSQYKEQLPTLYIIDPRIVAVALGLMAIYLLINYFFWVKRTLFLSVGGRPLITVSITDWNARKLEGMDSFINMFSQVKDALHSGEQIE